MHSNRHRRRFRIEGRVQGIGFRVWARHHALDLGLAGHVRNHPDGSVEVEAAGPPERLDRMRELLQQGPVGARVSAVRELPPGSAELPSRFDIAF